MPGPDTVVEETPVLVALYMALSALLMWIAYRSLHYVWMHTIGWVVGKIANVGIPTGFFGHVHPLSWLDSVNNTVMNWLAEQALANEEAMGKWFHAAAHLQEWIAREMFGLGADVFSWLDGFHHHLIGKVLKAFIAPVEQAIRALKVAVHAAERAAVAVEHKAAAIAHELPGDITHGLKKGLPWILPGIPLISGLIKDVRGISHWVYRHRRRIARLEKLLGATGMAVAMANTLGLPNWRCLTRGNIGRAARHWCGLDKWLVDMFLLGTVEAFVATDLCEFTHLLTVATKAQVPALTQLVTVEDALVGCHGAEKPLAFNLPPAKAPPLQSASPLAA